MSSGEDASLPSLDNLNSCQVLTVVTDKESEITSIKCKGCGQRVARISQAAACTNCNAVFHNRCTTRGKCCATRLIRQMSGNEEDDAMCKMDMLAKENEELKSRNILLEDKLHINEKEIIALQAVNKELSDELREYQDKFITKKDFEIKLETIFNEIKTLKDKLNFSSCNISQNTYSNIASKVITPCEKSAKATIKSSDHILVVKNTVESNNCDILNSLKSKIYPNKENIKINQTKIIKDGIIFNCNTEDSLIKLKNSIEANFSNEFSVNKKNKFNPRVIVKNVSNKYDNNSFVDDICDCNVTLNSARKEIKVITTIKGKFSTNYVLELSPKTRKAILDLDNTVYTSWEKCFVEDHHYIMRCFKCTGYGHIQKDCKSKKIVCFKCGEDHWGRDCKSTTYKCTQCAELNTKDTKMTNKLAEDHCATDKACPQYQKLLNKLKSNINYE